MLTRRENIFKHMKDGSFALFYSGKAPKKSADQTYPFCVDRNFYYLTGIDQEEAYLLLIKGTKQESILFVENRSPERILWDGPVLTFDEAKGISLVNQVKDYQTFDSFLEAILSSSRVAVYGKLNYAYFDFQGGISKPFGFAETYAKKLLSIYPFLQIKDLHLDIAKLRSIKDNKEIEAIVKAIDITNEGINLMMKKAKEGIKEYELAAYYHFTLESYKTSPSFDTIAASGPNGTILHYKDNNRTTEKGELILFDLGTFYQHYASDISRTFPLSGRFSELQKKYYDIVLECNKKCIEYVKPGITWQELNVYAKKILSDGLIKLGKIKDETELQKYYYHSIGHFLGLDVHDVGDYTAPLKEGQIITIEPGLYIKEDNIGIRIEDNILITKEGAKNLSAHLIKEIKDIELFMK